jgi:hypothetical protein
MPDSDADALIADLQALASRVAAAFEQHPVVQAWLDGRLDGDRSFALQAQIYYHVAQTVPLLEGCARTCTALAASEPMYALLAQHYAQHAVEESRPAPHDVLLLESLRRQGFSVERLPPPCAAVQTYLERGRWAAVHAPLRELGRGYVLETVSERVSARLAHALAGAGSAGPARGDDFYCVHATTDRSEDGHLAQTTRLLRQLGAFPAFAATAAEVIAGAEEARDYLGALLAHVEALSD